MRHRSLLLRATLVALVVLVTWASPAAAHTDLDSTEPAEGSTVDQPVDAVVLVFTQPVEAVDDGFAVLDGDGTERTPTVESPDGGTTWVLGLDPPASPGQVAVRWAVRAADGHVLDGGFSFTVTASGATTTVPDAPPTSDTAAPTTTAATAPLTTGGADDGTTAGAVEDFLAAGDDDDGLEAVESAGRTLALAGGLVAVGALLAAAWALRGDADDLRAAAVLVRQGALVAVVGAGVELGARVAIEGAPTEGTGLAVAVRLLGAVALLVGMRPSGRAVDAGAEPDAGSAGAADGSGVDRRLRPDLGRSPLAVLGAFLLIGSLALDGHTVTEGARVVTAAVAVVHALAGALWVGGVVLVVVVLRARCRRGVAAGTAELAARYSVVATVALVAVALAGVGLTATILDGPGDLVDTAWGRLLAVKLVLVVVAAGLGAYNNRVLVPALTAGEDGAPARFARVLGVEAVVLVGIVVVTAWLVAASTV